MWAGSRREFRAFVFERRDDSFSEISPTPLEQQLYFARHRLMKLKHGRHRLMMRLKEVGLRRFDTCLPVVHVLQLPLDLIDQLVHGVNLVRKSSSLAAFRGGTRGTPPGHLPVGTLTEFVKFDQITMDNIPNFRDLVKLPSQRHGAPQGSPHCMARRGRGAQILRRLRHLPVGRRPFFCTFLLHVCSERHNERAPDQDLFGFGEGHCDFVNGVSIDGEGLDVRHRASELRFSQFWVGYEHRLTPSLA
mmetsp:Transcript_69735/g.191341  ORF Transcript_69735/g.191341 Transcript_69735/m.191341 type:complete len:247 (-) Transcript_69735:1808-2548(-)|eukprot:7147272-Prymnesium_polylepis.2